MIIRIVSEDRTYKGTAVEIIDEMKKLLWDAENYPEAESYIKRMQEVYKRMTERNMILPDGNTETRARVMFKTLAEIGTFDIVEDD